MSESVRGNVTRALSDLQSGDRTAVNRVLPLIYDELRALAGSYFRRQRSDHTLQPTALVHEAFVRLVDGANTEWQSRKHFFDVAAMAMRQLLADHARRRGAAKRGGDLAKVTLGDPEAGSSMGNIDLVALDDALTKLSELDERQGRIVPRPRSGSVRRRCRRRSGPDFRCPKGRKCRDPFRQPNR